MSMVFDSIDLNSMDLIGKEGNVCYYRDSYGRIYWADDLFVCELAKGALKDKNIFGWISAKDILPKKNFPVLVVLENDKWPARRVYHSQARWDEDAKTWEGLIADGDKLKWSAAAIGGKVTHWKPWPDPIQIWDEY